MRKYQKAMIIGGVTVAVLTPAAIAAADEWYGNGNGNGQGRGNGAMVHECDGSGQMEQMRNRYQNQDQTQDQTRTQDQTQARDGTGPYHDEGSPVRPMDGTGEQHRGGR